MKIIILHGDDILKSYERLTKFQEEAKKRGWEVTDYDLDSIANQSLFGTERFYILKDYKLLNKKDISNLPKYDGNLIIFNEGNVPVTFIKSLPKDIKIEKFDLPQLLWKFLDNMTIINFHELIKTQAVEYVLAMMAWKLRQKYIKNPTPDVASLISELAEIDVKVKTSKANLKDSLDLLIVKKLG